MPHFLIKVTFNVDQSNLLRFFSLLPGSIQLLSAADQCQAICFVDKLVETPRDTQMHLFLLYISLREQT